ncbi:MAG: prolyl oligopeptidase family serine peptidase [Hyphomicrobiales bacterium]
MRHLITAVILILTATTELVAQNVGIAELTIPAPHHNQDLQVAVMFPATVGKSVMFAENAVFYGTLVLEKAEPTPGRHPVVLLSHGWGGNYTRMAWLSAGLASKGAIVVAVNHPNSTTFDINFDTAFNHWTRAQDLSTALDYVLQDGVFAPYIDATRISATGFSYGGWTALSLAGVKGRRDGFWEYCAAAGPGSQFCAELAKAGIDISAIDQDSYEASYLDPRVRRVAAIDPGLTWGLTPADLRGLNSPLLLVGLGEGADRLNATDTSAMGSNFEVLVPNASVEVISPAMHFTALGVCKPAGEAILKEENDDPVCTDPTGTDRATVLNTIIHALADHFELR